MKFTDKNGVFYSMIRTENETSEGAAIFKFTAWNERGQMIDVGEVAANTPEEARDKILHGAR